MKSLTVLEKAKLSSVQKLLKEITSYLVQCGFKNTEVQIYLTNVLSSTNFDDIQSAQETKQISLSEFMVTCLNHKGEPLIKNLKRMEQCLYLEKCALETDIDSVIVSRKNSETLREKVKGQKKEKKQKKEKRRKQAPNAILELEKKQTKDSERNQENLGEVTGNLTSVTIIDPSASSLSGIFRPILPLQQSSPNCMNIFSFNPDQGLVKIQAPTTNIFTRPSPSNNSDAEEIRKNMLQIRMMKSFIEKQMILDMLSNPGNQDDVQFDVADLGDVGSFMMGR